MFGREVRSVGPEKAVRWSFITLALVCALVWIAALAGCGSSGTGGSTSGTNESRATGSAMVGCPPDPSAAKVTISRDAAGKFKASPGRIPLKRTNRDKFQWHNTTSELLYVVFIQSGGAQYQPQVEVLEPNAFSSVHHVCLECPLGTYEYRLWRRNASGTWEPAPYFGGGPPTEPEVFVD